MQSFIRIIMFLSFLLWGQNYGIAGEDEKSLEMEEGTLLHTLRNAEEGETDIIPLLSPSPQEVILYIPPDSPSRLQKVISCGASCTSCICGTMAIFLICIGAGFINGGTLDHHLYSVSHYSYYANSAKEFYEIGALMMVGAVVTGFLALISNRMSDTQ